MPAPPDQAQPETLPERMRAIALTAFGGPEHLATIDLPVPAPGPGEVLIRVHTVAVNRQDTFTMRGLAQARYPRSRRLIALLATIQPVLFAKVLPRLARSFGESRQCLDGLD